MNKSRTSQHNLISNNYLVSKGVSFITLQEPAIDGEGFTLASREWTAVYPTLHRKPNTSTRAVTLVRASLSPDTWKQIDFPSGDVVVIQIHGVWGKLTLFNIYNDCASNNTVRQLTEFHSRNQAELAQSNSGEAHVMWVGDFNRHHPYWDDHSDDRLFTSEAIEAAEKLIEAVVDAGLELALPSGIPTHRHNVTKRWSRLDQVFLSDHSDNILISCNTQPDHWGINTDHLPIRTELDLKAVQTEIGEIPNYREADWEGVRKELSTQLAKLPPATQITNQGQMDESCKNLTKAIQRAIAAEIPMSNPTPKSKRWWTKELTQLRRLSNKLGRQSHQRGHEPEHDIHRQHDAAKKKYRKVLDHTKRHHWRDWLEKGEDPDLWTAHRYVSAPRGDGGKTRIPSLKFKVDEEEHTATSNQEKGRVLAKNFFPTKPRTDESLAEHTYPKACSRAGKITTEQIRDQLCKLKPFKAPGPDGIPNIVLTRCADLIIERLLYIFRAMLDENLMFKPWKESTTVVIRKPGKSNYSTPKAYMRLQADRATQHHVESDHGNHSQSHLVLY